MKIKIESSFSSIVKKINVDSKYEVASTDKEIFKKIYKELVVPSFMKKNLLEKVFNGKISTATYISKYELFFGKQNIRAKFVRPVIEDFLNPKSISLNWIIDNIDLINSHFKSTVLKEAQAIYSETDLSELILCSQFIEFTSIYARKKRMLGYYFDYKSDDFIPDLNGTINEYHTLITSVLSLKSTIIRHSFNGNVQFTKTVKSKRIQKQLPVMNNLRNDEIRYTTIDEFRNLEKRINKKINDYEKEIEELEARTGTYQNNIDITVRSIKKRKEKLEFLLSGRAIELIENLFKVQ